MLGRHRRCGWRRRRSTCVEVGTNAGARCSHTAFVVLRAASVDHSSRGRGMQRQPTEARLCRLSWLFLFWPAAALAGGSALPRSHHGVFLCLLSAACCLSSPVYSFPPLPEKVPGSRVSHTCDGPHSFATIKSHAGGPVCLRGSAAPLQRGTCGLGKGRVAIAAGCLPVQTCRPGIFSQASIICTAPIAARLPPAGVFITFCCSRVPVRSRTRRRHPRRR